MALPDHNQTNPDPEGSPMNDNTAAQPKVGEIMRAYAGRIIQALGSDPDALANALDPVWTKQALGMHGRQFSLVRRADDIARDPAQHVRYYTEPHPFPGGDLRLCKEWYADQRDAIIELLVSLDILEPGEAPVVTPEDLPTVEVTTPEGERREVNVGGTLRGYPIGNAQNYAVRTVLDLTERGPSKAQWAETIEDFGVACAYCETPFTEEVKAVIEHVVPINKTHMGENVIGNIVPARTACNADKGGKSLEDWLAATSLPIDVEAARARIRSHRERHGYIPLRELTGGEMEQVETAISAMRDDAQGGSGVRRAGQGRSCRAVKLGGGWG